MIALCADTKDALAHAVPSQPHCRAALVRAMAYYGTQRGGDRFVTTKNSVARLFWSLLDDRKQHPIVTSAVKASRVQRFSVSIADALRGTPPVPKAECDRLSELRAAFLLLGSVSAGAGGYHLEFSAADARRESRLGALLRDVGVEPKRSVRRGRVFLYYKNFAAIANVLARIGAHEAVLALEDVRALRETKNRVRRLVNTEAANLERAARAAGEQRRMVERVARTLGLRRLPRPLREIASLRLRFAEESLLQLGLRCRPPIGKAAAYERMATLSRFANRQGPREGDG